MGRIVVALAHPNKVPPDPPLEEPPSRPTFRKAGAARATRYDRAQ